MPYPSSERLIDCLALCLSLICEVDFVVALCLASKCRSCVYKERSCLLPVIVLPQILSGGSLCGKPCVDELVEILLCEGGDVELCARTSKHIRVFAIDPLSLNSISFTLCLALIHIVHTLLYAWLCLFVCLTCV